MADTADTNVTSRIYGATAPRAVSRAIGGLAFDWVAVVLNLLFVSGLYLDGWAHNHDRVDERFFTPWHAFFYAGFGLIVLLMVFTVLINRVRGYPWQRATPAGYALSWVGVVIFAAGGLGDLIWHEIFGVEEDLEALLSPTHLALIMGLALIVSGPLRAAWQRIGRRPNWRTLGAALFSLTALISSFTFIMMYAHPITFNIAGATHREFDRDIGQMAGVLGILVTTLLLMGPTLLVMRRWALPPGSLTVVWGANLTAMTIVNYHHAYTIYQYLIILGAIVVIDRLRMRLQPSIRNTGGWRVFAFIAPVLYIGGYVVALLLTEGSNWSVHLLSGAVMLAGLGGWLLSYLLIPPRMPVESSHLLR